MNAAMRRTLRAQFTALLVALRMPYNAENLRLLLDNFLTLLEDDPDMTARWLNSLHQSTFPHSTQLTPSTDSQPERN